MLQGCFFFTCGIYTISPKGYRAIRLLPSATTFLCIQALLSAYGCFRSVCRGMDTCSTGASG